MYPKDKEERERQREKYLTSKIASCSIAIFRKSEVTIFFWIFFGSPGTPPLPPGGGGGVVTYPDPEWVDVDPPPPRG